jgi:lysyl-tRNA synthetase class 2
MNLATGMKEWMNAQPEFTVLEFYVAYKDYEWMMKTRNNYWRKRRLHQWWFKVLAGEKEIDFKAPYKRITCTTPSKNLPGLISAKWRRRNQGVCKQLGIYAEANWGKGKLIDEIFGLM